MIQNEYVYGPVPSRRLGRSLGIDLVPFKTCTYDCVYCQLGRTTCKTTTRKAFVPVDAVLAEVKGALAAGPYPDCIAFAGSGEPTLHSQIGEVIEQVKKLTTIPVVVLTNGALLGQDAVRDSLMAADVVAPSLDAGDAVQFVQVNRPHPDIDFEQMCDGLIRFTHTFKGDVWLEIFLLAGVTDTPPSVRKISAIAEKISPARVQLNTVCRPPAERNAVSISLEQMLALKKLFTCRTDIIGRSQLRHTEASGRDRVDDRAVTALIGRRPCSARDVADGLGIHVNEALKHLNRLITSGHAHVVHTDEEQYYVAPQP